MKTIRVLLLVSFCIVTISAFAQDDLKQQIISFTDSTEIIIRNGRKLAVDQTIKGDSQSAIETINYLKKNVDHDYVIFYPVEELLLDLANSNFDQFLYTAAHFNNLLEDKTKTIQTENITGQIHAFLSQEISLIKKDLERSNLNPEGKELVELYIRYYEREDAYKLNKAIRQYEKTYPNSEYKSFLDLIADYTQPGGMNFCLGYGHEFLNGNITNTFPSHFQSMNMEIEWFSGPHYFSFYIQGSVETLQSKNDIPVMKFDLINTPDDDVSSLKYGIKLGRAWVSNRTVNLFSYVSIGGYQMISQHSNFDVPDIENKKLKLTSVFSPGIGTACDINLKHFKNKQSGETVGKWFIRPNIGYDLFVTGKDLAKGGSLFMNLTMGIGLGN